MTFDEVLGVLRAADLVVGAGEGSPAVAPPDPAATRPITGIAVDSRSVVAGGLFIALRGAMDDGHRFISTAVQGGAAAVVVETAVEVGVPVVVVRDSQRAAKAIAEAWYRHPASQLRLIGITGTNGKTTTTSIMRHLLNTVGDTGSIGTLGAFDGQANTVPSSAGSLTTPGPVDLQATLRAMVDVGVKQIAMETSSHALDQGRLDALTFEAGIFTNLTREHLDYHRTMEHYIAAKLRLADLVAARGGGMGGGRRVGSGILAVNADDAAWGPLRDDRRTISWGVAADADVTVRAVACTGSGTTFGLGGRFGGRTIELPLLGEFNVANAVGAAVVALAFGMPLAAVAERLATVPQVPGRMERLASGGFTVLRDYAHTPDAFERVLAMLRPLVAGRLIMIFGCGGDRDRGKRPIMGRVAAERADLVVLTTDNPRHEDPDRIIDDIVAQMPAHSYRRILDRETAIARMIDEAEPGDLILLAGKGHETYQIEGDVHRHFDEREIVRSLVS